MDMNTENLNKFKPQNRLRSRKSSGPHRSTTPLDNFLTPGVLFRFPSDFTHLIDIDSKLMSATFVSACAPVPLFKYFENIDLESFKLETTLSIDLSSQSITKHQSLASSPVLLNDSDDYDFLSNSSIRSVSPISVLSTTSTGTLESLHKFTKRKKCESCGTRKTPYWRDGWNAGVILCNACGIRFHKYRKYCEICQCIAKKDDLGRLHCPKCFDKL